MIDLKGIKNIIFDLGGVLLNLDYNLTKQAFIDLGFNNFDAYYSKAKQGNLFNQFETGAITEAEFCDGLRSASQLNFSDKELIQAWNAMLLRFPSQRKKLLLKLKEVYNLSLLSNTNETHVRAFNDILKEDINEDSLAPLFNTHYLSNEIGLRKPNKSVFEYVLTQNGYNASETLFLDDSIQHIEGAKLCGIHTFHITDTPVEELFSNFLT